MLSPIKLLQQILPRSKYSSAQAAVEMAKSVSNKQPQEADYVDIGVNIKPVGLKRKK